VFAGPTWDEDPEVAWQRLRGIARCDDSGHDASLEAHLESGTRARRAAVDDLHDELRRTLRWKVTRVMTGQIIDARGRLLRKLAADATRFLALRERAKAALLVLGGEERRVIAEAARRLHGSGMLADPQDVMFLSDAELEDMLLGSEPVSTEELGRRRSAHANALTAAPLPETFEGLPGVEELPPIEGDVLRGWAASPGRVQGQARIIRGLSEAGRLEPGEIIVARTTDPSWTPLFLVAGGIVLEEGGPLSHAAIVARELGLPAVLNVKGATSAIADGSLVEVDGDAGIVTRSGDEWSSARGAA
jgi:pyruvate,water dikinase